MNGRRSAGALLGLVLVAACGADTGTAGASRDPSCVPEADSALCTSQGKNCGAFTARDSCGTQRSVECGQCSGGQVCSAVVANVCGTQSPTCTAESNGAFCARFGKNCQTFTAEDNCGKQRSANCGTCSGSQVCGAVTVNVCGAPACTPESNAAFCSRHGKNCQAFTAADNCGAQRAVDCGTCSGSQVCGAVTANVCGTPASSGGCGHAPAATGFIRKTMTVAGKARTYDLYVPAGVTGSAPLPLVVVFHHSGGTIADAESYGIQNYSVAKAIYLFPQGLETGRGVGWDLGCSNYDMQFVDALLAQTEKDACIDTGRIFATGFSWGADMTIATGCCRGNVFRAIAPTSGTGWGLSGCTATRPAFRVTVDSADPYYSVGNVHAVTLQYKAAHHCADTTTAATPSPPCVGYTGCDAPVIECVFDGIGHWFPTGGQEQVWKFFGGF